MLKRESYIRDIKIHILRYGPGAHWTFRLCIYLSIHRQPWKCSPSESNAVSSAWFIWLLRNCWLLGLREAQLSAPLHSETTIIIIQTFLKEEENIYYLTSIQRPTNLSIMHRRVCWFLQIYFKVNLNYSKISRLVQTEQNENLVDNDPYIEDDDLMKCSSSSIQGNGEKPNEENQFKKSKY